MGMAWHGSARAGAPAGKHRTGLLAAPGVVALASPSGFEALGGESSSDAVQLMHGNAQWPHDAEFDV